MLGFPSKKYVLNLSGDDSVVPCPDEGDVLLRPGGVGYGPGAGGVAPLSYTQVVSGLHSAGADVEGFPGQGTEIRSATTPVAQVTLPRRDWVSVRNSNTPQPEGATVFPDETTSENDMVG